MVGGGGGGQRHLVACLWGGFRITEEGAKTFRDLRETGPWCKIVQATRGNSIHE